jgi:glycosyltransferase involved in cell wall biosynthesis
MPKYTVVVPTLNRSHLLDGTLRSLSLFDHESFEVVVSNNCSTDDTEQVVARYVESDSRFRYVKPERKLCMSDHWEFALKAVRGDYFLYLGDDDSFDRNILSALDHYLVGDGEEGVYWKQAVYYYDSWFDKSLAGNLFIPPYTGERRSVSSQDVIAQAFEMNFYTSFPMGTSFCFRTDIVRSIVKRFGVFFARPYPDYTSSMMYLPSIRRYLSVDIALSVMGKSKDSNAAANAYGPKERVREFIREHDGDLYPHVPLNYHLVVNGEAECVKAAQAHRPEDLAGYDINWAKYFRVIYDNLQYGVEALENEKGKYEYVRKLARMPLGVQAKVLPYVLRGEAYRLRQRLKHRLTGNGAAQAPSHAQSLRHVHATHTCKRLPDIVSCSEALAEHNSAIGYF